MHEKPGEFKWNSPFDPNPCFWILEKHKHHDLEGIPIASPTDLTLANVINPIRDLISNRQATNAVLEGRPQNPPQDATETLRAKPVA